MEATTTTTTSARRVACRMWKAIMMTSTTTPGFRRAHPRSASERWIMAAVSKQDCGELRSQIRHEPPADNPWQRASRSGMGMVCAGSVTGYPPVPTPVPAHTRRVWPPPKCEANLTGSTFSANDRNEMKWSWAGSRSRVWSGPKISNKPHLIVLACTLPRRLTKLIIPITEEGLIVRVGLNFCTLRT